MQFRQLTGATTLLLAALAAQLGGLTAAPARAAEVHPGMLRFPDVSATQIVFIYDNDVWLAPKQGGQAYPLSSPAGMESYPRFSADGGTIAYCAAYDGNTDVYEIPATGGVPRRLTVQPYGARVIDYAPDGRVVYSTWDVATSEAQMWYADPHCGLPERLPLKYGDMASFAADGSWLAFCPVRHLWQETSWNRYQGGQAPDIWTFNLATRESRKLTDWPGLDDIPMVDGERIFYLSDAGPEHRRNIWLYEEGQGSRQVTQFSDGEVRWPALGPADIVFQQGGRLWRLPLDNLQPVELQISLSGDRPNLRTQELEVQGFEDASMSPQAKRIAIESHGDIWSIPAKQGVALNLTPSDGIAERQPSWSPDGRWIAYISDESGRYEVHVCPGDGSGAGRQVSHDSPCRMYWLLWSPDSKRILCLDRSSTYWVVEVESGKKTVLATDYWGAINAWTGWANLGVAWSPDSRWVALVLSDELTRNGVVQLVNVETLERHPVTSKNFASGTPAFDPQGELLYVTTEQAFQPVFSAHEDYDANYVFQNSMQIACITLRQDLKSPLLPSNDEEESAPASEDKPAAAAEPAAPEGAAAAKPDEPLKAEPLKIDFEGIIGRIQALPAEAGIMSEVHAAPGKLFYQRWISTGNWWGNTELRVLDLEAVKRGTPGPPGPDGKPSGPDSLLFSNVNAYQLSADASKVLLFSQGALYIAATAPGSLLEAPVPLPARSKTVDPRSEWRQIIFENWRVFKEKFYDPGLHGVDWDAARDRALAMLPYAVCKEDFGFIIAEMNAELNCGHTYVWSGVSDWPGSAGMAQLGCDFEAASDSQGRRGIRISRIYSAGEGELGASSPLLAPGVNVREGQFLLAINDLPLDPLVTPYKALLGQAGKTLKLSVGDNAVRDDSSRDVLISGLYDDAELRHRAWVEGNRRYVQEHSGGRLGYLHVRNTSDGGRIDLQRQLNSQCNYEALIIDERYNDGGSLPLRFIDLLTPPTPVYVQTQYGRAGRAPSRRVLAPMVMLINQYAGSCGDAFPYLFREAGLGPLIGTRTWGGLVGLSGGESFLDGSGVVVPSLGVYTSEGQWLAEGYGVAPDIEVVNDPSSVAAGRDLQLERAIAEALKRADAEPYRDPPHPPYEDKSGVRSEEYL